MKNNINTTNNNIAMWVDVLGLIDSAYEMIANNCNDWGMKSIYENRDEKQRALQNLNETSRMVSDVIGGTQ